LDEQAEIFIYERGSDVSFANCGLPYYLGGVIRDRQQLVVFTPERFRDWLKIEVRAGQDVTKIDRDQKMIEIRNAQTGTAGSDRYDFLVLSPGALPIHPRLLGAELPGIFTLRTLQDMDRISAWLSQRRPGKAVVVGGGYIGLEMVENLAQRGCEVALLEAQDQVLPIADPEMTGPLAAELGRQGIEVHLSDGVTGVDPGPADRLTVATQSGARIVAGMVIVAMGVRPDTSLARQAGLRIGPSGGIQVDDQMRTSDPAIFAVGDAVEIRDFVTGQPALIPLAGPANRQGRIAADVICGRPARYRGSQGTAVVGLFGMTLAMTGPTEKTLRRLSIPYQKSYTHSLHHAGYYPDAEMMTLKLLFAPDTGRVLGAQAVGRQGVDKRIDVIAMAIQKQATVYDLEETELCYAPQFGSAKDPVNIAGFVAANVLRGDTELAHWESWREAGREGGPQPLVLDVRTAAEAATAAAPGAVNIPLGELRRRLGELPRDREIWVHCGVGQRSYYASRILKQHGFQVRNLSGGFRSFQAIVRQR
jgi:NADPH-dependent 2,4-dienoyl-CoA reductase/sulfur reductase-like enzyme/rhodanese-related sulfurtransferase